jgi:Tfp pilus assembly PilM family ATPase
VVLSGLQDRLAPLRTWLFPRRVYLQLEDQAISAMALEGERIAWQERVPLPAGLCVNGEPLMVEALGDLLGDLLVERGYAGAHVKAVLPRAATAWRLIEWPEAAWPEQPELLVRQQQDELGLPWSLQDADVLLDPLLAELPRSLLVAAQRSLLEAWIEVFSQAGVALDGLEALPICLWRAVKPQLARQGREGFLALLQLEPDQSWLLALDQGQPLGEWPLPVAHDHEALAVALQQWRQRHEPTTCLLLGPDSTVRELGEQLPLWLGCPVLPLEFPGGEAAIWGLAAGELAR